MDAVQTSPTTSTVATGQAKAETGVISSDFETFLKMLTAQIQNQDPLNPMDSSEYAVQLATFAGVEQQVLTNDLLREQAAGGAGELAQIAHWVGMEAQHDGAVTYSGSAVDLTFPAVDGEESRELIVASVDGNVLHRLDVSGADTDYSWTGQTEDGQEVLQGTYALSLVRRWADGTSQTDAVSSFARVTEVRSTSDGTELVLAGGQVVSPAEITALRD